MPHGPVCGHGQALPVGPPQRQPIESRVVLLEFFEQENRAGCLRSQCMIHARRISADSARAKRRQAAKPPGYKTIMSFRGYAGFTLRSV
jgi:hypothetical protein